MVSRETRHNGQSASMSRRPVRAEERKAHGTRQKSQEMQKNTPVIHRQPLNGAYYQL